MDNNQMQNTWDIRYSGETYAYGKEPNAFFRECLSTLKPGKLLLPAEGEGRNAAWAAEKGWTVTAFDQSEEGQKKALRLAQEKGVAIDYHLVEVEAFNPKPQEYDAVAIIYLHLSPEIRIPFHQKIVECIKPGGHLIIEAFTTKQVGYDSGGPRDVNLLYTLGNIFDDFHGFTFKVGEEQQVVLKEGEYHSGKASVIRLFGKKKTSAEKKKAL